MKKKPSALSIQHSAVKDKDIELRSFAYLEQVERQRSVFLPLYPPASGGAA